MAMFNSYVSHYQSVNHLDGKFPAIFHASICSISPKKWTSTALVGPDTVAGKDMCNSEDRGRKKNSGCNVGTRPGYVKIAIENCPLK